MRTRSSPWARKAFRKALGESPIFTEIPGELLGPKDWQLDFAARLSEAATHHGTGRQGLCGGPQTSTAFGWGFRLLTSTY
eukprot:4832509-Pyramimonas_sp.AAC.1